MKKTYQKPEAEVITLDTKEVIASDILDGIMGLESSIF
jgi:hypothetical protein